MSTRNVFLSALAVAVAMAESPVAAQPLDPYGEAPAAKAEKAPAEKKGKAKGKGKGKGKKAAAAEGPQDPYADAAPKANADAPQDPYAEPAKPAPAAQPAPVPAPAPAAASPGGDGLRDPYEAEVAAAREVNDAVAAALVERARELFDARAYADARQLAAEALVRSADGPSSSEAKEILRLSSRQLGIQEPTEAELSPPADAPPAAVAGDRSPGADAAIDPYANEPRVVSAAPAARRLSGRGTLAFYGVASGAVLGLGLAGGLSDGDDAAMTIGLLGGGALGGVSALWLAGKYQPTVAQARTVGSAATWGGLTFGLMADVFEVGGTTGSDVALGAALGTGAGLAAGTLIARNDLLTAGDVTLVDSLATWGMVGGLTLGVSMQPYRNEAYSLNAALGAASGVAIGLLASSRVELSTRRLVAVDMWALGGAAAPWLLYALAADDNTDSDEQLFGLLSTAGLVGGAWLGFRFTRNMDRDGRDRASDAPMALLRRGGDGAWSLGGVSLRPAAGPLGPALGRSALVDLVGARF